MSLTGLFKLPPADRHEILRYAGVRTESPDLGPLMESVLNEAEPVLQGRVCWQQFSIVRKDSILDLGFAETGSRDLIRHLDGCDQIILFGATIGLPLDRLISKYSALSPARALMLQAVGTERIEGLCDIFCGMLQQKVRETGLEIRSRFSPGYGDLPLDIQKDIFRVLECSRTIGLTLNESLIMSPSKSVTAIVGLGKPCCSSHRSGCSQCSKTDCVYRSTL